VLGGAAPLLAHIGWFLLQWFLPGVCCAASLAGALLTLVWICFLNGANDRSYGTYVPKRLRQSQFIEWIKSRIKDTPASSFLEWLKSKIKLDPLGTIDAFVYSLKVSRTRADRRRRRRLRKLPGIFALLLALVTLPWILLSLSVDLLSQARAPLLFARSVTVPVAGSCFAAAAAAAKVVLEPMSFDCDSFQILVDSGATHSFTHLMEDFVEPPTPVNRVVHGVGNGTATFIGTVAWPIADDQGRVLQERYEGSTTAPQCHTESCRLSTGRRLARITTRFAPALVASLMPTR